MSTNQNNTNHIVVFGASAPKPGEPLYELSVELGDKLAKSGYSVCSGGYGGTMEGLSKVIIFFYDVSIWIGSIRGSYRSGYQGSNQY